ncbi:MAG: DUF413 domain-containing protein [Vicinamibacteria bacterium]|nr:DUF413 domain-containing protein [Vicinamibacteria bacterium]
MATLPTLTAHELQLVQTNRERYLALGFGRQKPTTPEEEHFVWVCKRFVDPETEEEIAWVKWMQIRQYQNQGTRKAIAQREISKGERPDGPVEDLTDAFHDWRHA